jgi:hypothetical protein
VDPVRVDLPIVPGLLEGLLQRGCNPSHRPHPQEQTHQVGYRVLDAGISEVVASHC